MAEAIERACTGQAGAQISEARLARALVVAARADATGDASQATALALVGDVENRLNTLRGARRLLQEQLANPGSAGAKELQVQPAPPILGPGDPDWLFQGRPYTLTCAPATPEEPAQWRKLSPVVVRGTVEDLSKLGDERAAAGAAKVGWDNNRVTDLAGDRKHTRTLTIDGAAGLAFGNEDRAAILYADYSRSRVRIRTSPTPTTEDQDGRADDVDALEIGALGTFRPAGWLRTTGRFGATFDYVTDARSLHGTLELVPITGGLPRLGICNFNAFGSAWLGIEGRCTVKLEADYRHVTRVGTAVLTDADDLLALGGTVGAEFRRPLDVDGKPQDGLVANVSYSYLNLVTGHGPDIDRIDISIAYRWWAGDLGFDLGLTYADGTERKSLADEHRLALSFGLIY